MKHFLTFFENSDLAKGPPPCEKVDFYGVNETFLDIFGHPDAGLWPLFWCVKRTKHLEHTGGGGEAGATKVT